MELSPPVQPQKFGKRVVLGFAVTGTILAAISGMMFSSITQLLRSSDWVAHSYRVLANAVAGTASCARTKMPAQRGKRCRDSNYLKA